MANYILCDMIFDWDDNKAKANEQKHKVSFMEAATVFRDVDAVIIDDEKHSELEERFNLLGMSNELKMLIVCHCYRDNDEVIRIISARKANKHEVKQYGGKKHERTL